MTRADESYGGDVTAREAYDLLRNNPRAVLVDVRTEAEWAFVGLPDLAMFGSAPVLLEWQSFPSMTANRSFAPTLLSQLRQRNTPADAPVLFLCRSGGRSLAAARAMAGEGFTRCLNIVGGFEGPLDADRHRGAQDGWKALGLPWTQN